jgi:hypothetical protein
VASRSRGIPGGGDWTRGGGGVAQAPPASGSSAVDLVAVVVEPLEPGSEVQAARALTGVQRSERRAQCGDGCGAHTGISGQVSHQRNTETALCLVASFRRA